MEISNTPDRCLPIAYTPSTSTEELANVATFLKALGEPARLKILEIVAAAEGELVCACVFPNALGISQPTVSHHLKKLVEVGLLDREQHGKWAYFRLVPSAFEQTRAFLLPLLAAEPAVAGS
jgi:ArsR family transcriptional regulator